jgi:hypothetical protein
MGNGFTTMIQTRTIRSTVAAGIALTAAGVLLAGCTANPATVAEAPTTVEAALNSPSPDYLFAAISTRFESTETVVPEASLEDLVPSQKFSIEGRKAQSLAGGIAFGKVIKVTPGASYTVSAADDLVDIELPFDSPNALWRVAILTVQVERGLGDVEGDKTVQVGYVLDATLDADKLVDQLDDLGKVAVVLNRPGKFDFDPELYSVRWSGALLGLVDKNKEISFPGLGHESEEFVGDLETVDDVVAENKKTHETVEVEIESNTYVRSDE